MGALWQYIFMLIVLVFQVKGQLNTKVFSKASDYDELRSPGLNYMKIDDFSQPTFCYLQPESGFCLAAFKKYYYDVYENSCKQFTYGGCGGNQNKFDSMLSCWNTCKGK